ncbi:MAG: SDR family oxidoreductase [Cytophagales bacterium]
MSKTSKKVVIITGGSSGIGKGCAEVFGKNGYSVFITGRNPEKLEEAIADLIAKDISANGLACDVSQFEDNEKMFEACMKVFGRVDGLINNAGISMRALFSKTEVEVIERLMQINFFGTVYATKVCVDEIIKNDGFLVGVSSIAGYRGLPGRTGYSASKFAMQGFLESLRTELYKSKVNVLIACPGYTESNIRNTALNSEGKQQGETPFDESKLMSAETVARHILKAIKKKKKYLTLTAQGKLTVFMNKWFPGFMDKLVYNAIAKEKDSPFK